MFKQYRVPIGLPYDYERYPTIANVYTTVEIWNTMKEKINKIGRYFESTFFRCTMMIIYGLLGVHYLPVPCNDRILEEGTVFCVKRSNYYRNPKQVTTALSMHSNKVGHNRTFTHPFSCNDKTLISATSLCNGMTDCFENEDEMLCIYFDNLFYPLDLCKFIKSAEVTSYYRNCPSLIGRQVSNFSCTSPLSSMTPLIFDLLGQNQSHGRKMQRSAYCVYDPDPCGLPKGQQNGEHLLSCEEYVCQERHFKCPEFYCLPWRLVCNGLWEWPGGREEVGCKNKSCPGMFKCKNSSICVPPDDICDYSSNKPTGDCPLGDDEFFCKIDTVSQPCPSNCHCLLFGLYCKNTLLEQKNNFELYIIIKFNHVTLPLGQRVLDELGRPVILIFNHCKLESICKQMKRSNSDLQVLDVSYNLIGALSRHCFKMMPHIKGLNMSKNTIHIIKSHSFYSSVHIGQIDLSWNDITDLHDSNFAGLISLKSLNLSKNEIVSASVLTFQNIHITKIITDHYKVCCVKPTLEVICPIKPPWLQSCKRLLIKTVIRMLAYLVNSLGILMNICSLFIVLQKKVQSGDSFNSLIAWISTSDAFCCISFLTIAINDEVYSSNYLKHEFYLRRNILCYFSSILHSWNHSYVLPMLLLFVCAVYAGTCEVQ